MANTCRIWSFAEVESALLHHLDQRPKPMQNPLTGRNNNKNKNTITKRKCHSARHARKIIFFSFFFSPIIFFSLPVLGAYPLNLIERTLSTTAFMTSSGGLRLPNTVGSPGTKKKCRNLSEINEIMTSSSSLAYHYLCDIDGFATLRPLLLGKVNKLHNNR